MKTIKFLKIIPLLILLLFLITCKKETNVEKVTTQETALAKNDISRSPLDPKGDSIIIKKFDYTTFYSILHDILASDADKYYSKYSDTYKPHLVGGKKYPFSYEITKSVGEAIKKQINKNDFVHLMLTTRNGGLDILFVDSNNKKYFITNTSTLMPVSDEEFNRMDTNFKTGIYKEMTDTKLKLVDTEHTGDSSYGNTTEILIPYDDFDKYDPDKHTLVFLPGMVTDPSIVNSKKQSKMHHLTLIMCLMELSPNKALRNFPTVFYDDFCLKPPGC